MRVSALQLRVAPFLGFRELGSGILGLGFKFAFEKNGLVFNRVVGFRVWLSVGFKVE